MVRQDIPCRVRQIPYTVAAIFLPPDDLDMVRLESVSEQLSSPFLLLVGILCPSPEEEGALGTKK